MESLAMTRFLFLKCDFLGRIATPPKAVANAGIDVKLLHLLSARYV